MKKVSLVILLIFSSSFLQSQHLEFTDNCKQAYLLISALEFSKADSVLKLEEQNNPDNALPVLYENYKDFLKVVLGEQEIDYESLRNSKRERLRAIRSADKDSPYYLYSLANLNLQFAFARLRFKDYWPAVLEIRRAFHQLERNVELHPDFLPNYIGFGLLHTMVGSIPKNYKWVSWLASMDGTVEQGYEELFMVLERSQLEDEYSHLINEAAFFLTFLEMNISADKANADKLLALLEKEQNNQPFILFAKLSIFKKTSRNDRAIEIIDQYKPPKTAYPFHYLDYMHGLFYLNKLDQDANHHFEKYLDEFKGNSYIKSSYQKLAWLKLLEGDYREYKKLISKSKSEGNKHLGSDAHAEKEADKGISPKIDLLKSRLLFDGGYYEKSLEVLDKVNIDQYRREEVVECYYRLGRNYQELEQYDNAFMNFREAIRMGDDLEEYFAGNSALQSGLIYESLNELDSAGKYYNICLDLDFKTYKKSLDVKAKAALNRVKTKKGVR